MQVRVQAAEAAASGSAVREQAAGAASGSAVQVRVQAVQELQEQQAVLL